jgi:nucleotide-binding universal stress UspA family protein
MFRRILVPLDGTPFAELALGPAKIFAQRFDSELLLIHASPAHPLPAVSPLPARTTAAMAAMAQYLEEVADRLRHEHYNVEVAEPCGPASQVITEEAQRLQVSLIVMATHQRSWAESIVHPSTAIRVLHHALVPMLLIHAADIAAGQDIPGAAPAMPFTDTTAPVLLPLDGSFAAEQAIPLARAIAAAFQKPLLLLRVVEGYPAIAWLPNTPIPDEAAFIAGNEQIAHEYLEQRHAELIAAGFAVKTLVRTGSVARVIAQTAAEEHADIIVMATHSRTPLGRFLVGSVTRELLRLPGPAVLVRVAEQIAAEQLREDARPLYKRSPA